MSSPNMDIGRLVVRPTVVLPRETPISEAAQLMRDEGVSSALVGGPGSIVTERDFLDAWRLGLAPEDPVSAIATIDPLTVDASATVNETAASMLNHHVRHVVVRDHGRCLGIVSLRMVLAVLLQAAEPGIWLAELRVTLPENPDFWLG